MGAGKLTKGAVIILTILLIALIMSIILKKARIKLVTEATTVDNVKAFLTMIAQAEGTDRAGGHRCLYGSTPANPKTFTSFQDHPYLTGVWPGVKLSNTMCINAGQKPGCITTAAGRYQITQSTWKALKKSLDLPDFSPASQDKAAIELLRQKGALNDVIAGRISTAIDKVAATWASLPGNKAGQNPKSKTTVLAYYTNAGGQTIA